MRKVLKNKSPFLFFTFLTLSFFFFTSHLEADSSKKPINPSRIKKVDNFNSHNARNDIGGLWTAQALDGGELKHRFKKDDALNDLRGSSLWIRYKVPQKKKVYLETDLNDLDISQARELRFWVKRAAEDEHRLYVLLGDGENRVSRLQIKQHSSSEDERGWQEVRVPLKEFYNIDFENLKKFQLIVRGEKEGAAQGSFFFDDLVFIGPENLVFKSLSDNLKGFPERAELPNYQRFDLASLPSDKMLERLAEMTWKYFDNLVDKKTHLIVDHIQTGEHKIIGDYTSPTNIGLYFMACVSAYELGFISKDDAFSRIQKTFKTLKKMKKWNGFFYNFYNTTNLQVTRAYVSTVDSGWLAAGLMVVRKAFRGLANDADKFLQAMDFSLFYSKKVKQLRLGYDELEESMTSYHYGLLVSEARVASFVAIAKGDVPAEHWFNLYRTPPPEWEWQTQKPLGREREVGGEWVFGGMYRYGSYYIVPSWGGSMFEFLMPSLVMQEKKLSPQGLGKNNKIATKIHIEYALKEKGYPVWGLSPCSYPGGYGEFGVKNIGVKGYGDFGVITPHASIIALEYEPKKIIANIREFLNRYPVLGEYGLYDSVKMRGRNKVTSKYLALDQGMILVSITNYLKRGIIRKYFHEDRGVKKHEYLLEDEKFF